MAMSDMYERGYEEGRRKAVEQCFGYTSRIPGFETPDEEQDFLSGFEDGYADVDL